MFFEAPSEISYPTFAGASPQIPYSSFRIRTCRSACKQSILSMFRIDTYAKRGKGVMATLAPPALQYSSMSTPKPLHFDMPLRLDMNEQIECAFTLASRFYTDPHILEIEKEKIFLRTWNLVGTTMQPCGEGNGVKKTIADAETYFTTEIAGEPVLVLRDKSGTLRAFSNVCRHRAGPI